MRQEREDEPAVDAPDGDVPERETAGGVVGTSAKLFLLLVVVGALAVSGAGSTDAERVIGAVFADGELPFDVSVREAVRLPGGDRLVVFDLAEESEPWVEGEPSPTWLGLRIHRSASAVKKLFSSGGGSFGRGGRRRGGGGGEHGGEHGKSGDRKEVLERDELEWGAWRAVYVREREWKDGTWRDEVRVNLSKGATYGVLAARFADETNGSPEALRAFLQQVELR